MADITVTRSYDFGPTESVTSTKLDTLGVPGVTLDAGTIVDADVSATANIAGSKLADATVTKAKIEDVSDMKVLGNTSGATAAPAEVEILDDDTMATSSATTLATSESIKAYVDDQISSLAVFSKSFESSEFNIPAEGTDVNFLHGFSSIPKVMQIFARCKFAQVGYAIGDEILIGDYADAGQMQSLWASSTTIGWGHMYSGSTILIKEKTGNLNEAITSPNFKLVIRAYA